MHLIIQGLILGFIIVLPGMSGGTVFVIFGIYEQIVKDLVKFNFKPHIPLFLGILIGIFIGGNVFTGLFQTYRDVMVSFLLGCLLASIKSVVGDYGRPDFKSICILIIGLILGLVLIKKPDGLFVSVKDINWVTLIIGGALASVTMILPGVPGSSVLIIMGIYDSILLYIKRLLISKLIIFGIGSILGIVFLLKILEKIYEKNRMIISYFFVGLILASSRMLFPHTFNITIILSFLIGFSLVWLWNREGKKIEI